MPIVKTLEKDFTVAVPLTSTVKDLKIKINELLNDKNDVTLKFDNNIMEDTRTLSSYNIIDNSIIILVSKVIFIKLLTGQDLTIEFSPDHLVDKLKEKIRSKHGTAPENQVLIFLGKELEKGKKLSDYKILANSTIYLVQRLPGGNKSKLSMFSIL
jgi:short subunit fatty acids transporter